MKSWSSLSTPFIFRPIATMLLTIGLALAGGISYFLLPVAPLPQVDNPTISVTASLPGAAPDTMAATVATPLERALGAIAGVNEMTSSSSLGSTRITLQFDLTRTVDSAARDVQAAINASRMLLPSGMPSNPTYRKVNPADAPILMIALTSDSLTRGQMYDAASTVLAQKLSQVEGVGQASIQGGALPAVRVELDPVRLAANGVSLETVRTAISNTNANRPLGAVEREDHYWQVATNDQARVAADYAPLVLRWSEGNAIRLSDVADVSDSVQDVRTYGVMNGKPAILLQVFKQPDSNILEAVTRVRALLPQLKASIPAAIDLTIVSDRTPTLRASVVEVERSLVISIALVILVVFLFLRKWRATVIPAVAVPVSLTGTFGVMYLCGYTLDNLSLMALTVATGFVVDDAIVVVENVMRHMERGKSAVRAALDGAREIGFTVVSMSISLIAVFVPIMFMGGIVGRFFREFAVVMSAAILVSMLVSLTTTPMMCAALLRDPKEEEKQTKPRGRWMRAWDRFSAAIGRLERGSMRVYRKTLAWCLRHQPLVILVLLGVIVLNVQLYRVIEKGFIPDQDTGRVMGFIRADQATSFQAMERRIKRFLDIVQQDPAVEYVTGFTGGGQRNSANMFMSLKPLAERKVSSDEVINRLREKLKNEPGARLFMFKQTDIRIGGRQSAGSYEYTLQADEIQDLRTWEPRIRQVLSTLPELEDVNSDVQDYGMQTSLVVDRDAASKLGLTMSQIDATLNDAFGQRQVGVIYNPLNQYRVVMEAAPRFLQSPETLRGFFFVNKDGQQVPLTSFAKITTTNTPLSVSHQGGTPASTVSYSLAPNVSLSQANDAIRKAVAELGVPVSVRGSFSGTAGAFQQALAGQPLLILAAIITIYLVLGILYENLVHPLTILSTLPSAGVGALLALMLFKTEFSLIAFIGVILLIGLVKKNAIMMIDFALEREKGGHATPAQAIYRACDLRLRPILMTSMAAIFGALPLMLGRGDGAELRQPLGIAIVGGLLVSQLLTLYTTPVVYVLLERARHRVVRGWAHRPAWLRGAGAVHSSQPAIQTGE
ncbi:multidrug efflux RND transporter permease subunit [Diaphorobacter sp. HDW4B]|uniref:multidrug efflux RND transporter permease subunit n=1 Tax=Diaphorobacter sp. HDW4B TaxID=2714925 RepID=UPI00140C9290|nr:multidrug efflux RND transporter permease subunit [Diaphorobacter sp. HDW4B]QIL69718.1 multidrug efflux RND transporter permease subunit [Diaphorobacter sp. HDW4B]